MANDKFKIIIKERGQRVWKIDSDNKKDLLKDLRDLKFKL